MKEIRRSQVTSPYGDAHKHKILKTSPAEAKLQLSLPESDQAESQILMAAWHHSCVTCQSDDHLFACSCAFFLSCCRCHYRCLARDYVTDQDRRTRMIPDPEAHSSVVRRRCHGPSRARRRKRWKLRQQTGGGNSVPVAEQARTGWMAHYCLLPVLQQLPEQQQLPARIQLFN